MIIFKDWTITEPKDVLARQYDNLSRVLLVEGSLPEGYTWDMLVQVGKNMDIIHLARMEGGVGAVLTADQLSMSGSYLMQLRGTQGDVVRHTNVIALYIPSSMSGNGQWPSVPSEFSQMEARMRDLVSHPPVPGGNGYWLVWDVDEQGYVESEFPLPEGTGGGSAGADGGYYTPSVTQPDANTMRVSYTPSKTNMAAVSDVDVTLPAGPPGKDGMDGVDGKDGSAGADGKDGITPTIGGNGNWYIGDTDTGNPSRGATGPAGADGQPGADGAPGAIGATPNIQIGTVETLEAGSAATASITGTPENPILNMGIPQGEPGESSAAGSDISLGITGAAVGQIAKITAVDDTGKPTAWEPVEMPSGGGIGTQKILAQVTTQEKLSLIDIFFSTSEADELNNARVISIIIEMPLNPDQTERGALTVGVYSTAGAYVSRFINAQAGAVPRSTGYTGKTTITIVRGATETFETDIAVYDTNLADYSTTKGFNIVNLKINDPIRQSLRAFASTEFAAGTKITVWGAT